MIQIMVIRLHVSVVVATRMEAARVLHGDLKALGVCLTTGVYHFHARSGMSRAEF